MIRVEHEHSPGRWLKVSGCHWSSPDEAIRALAARHNPARLRARKGRGPWVMGTDVVPDGDAFTCDRCGQENGEFYASSGGLGEPAPLCRACASADHDLRYPSWDYPEQDATSRPRLPVVDPRWLRKKCAEQHLATATEQIQAAIDELAAAGVTDGEIVIALRGAVVRTSSAAIQIGCSDPGMLVEASRS